MYHTSLNVNFNIKRNLTFCGKRGLGCWWWVFAIVFRVSSAAGGFRIITDIDGWVEVETLGAEAVVGNKVAAVVEF